MKILILAPVHREKQFLNQKNNEPFLVGQAQLSWYHAFKQLGNKVFVFRYSDSIIIPNTLRIYISDFFIEYFPVWKGRFNRYSQKFHIFAFENTAKNKRFESFVKAYRPDVVLVSGGLVDIYPNTLIRLKKKYKFKAILESGVNPMYGASAYEKKLAKLNFFDHIFVNDKGHAKTWNEIANVQAVALPLSSADPSIHKKIRLNKNELNQYACDVCFVGTLNLNKQRLLKELVQFDLKIWGDIPPKVKILPELKKFYQGKADGRKMVKIFNAAKIVVNIHPDGMNYGGNMRTFEIPACGAFQLIDNVQKEWFIDGKEVVIYRDAKDLKKKATYYLAHDSERKIIAEAGYRKTLLIHTYKDRIKSMLAKI